MGEDVDEDEDEDKDEEEDCQYFSRDEMHLGSRKAQRVQPAQRADLIDRFTPRLPWTNRQEWHVIVESATSKEGKPLSAPPRAMTLSLPQPISFKCQSLHGDDQGDLEWITSS